MLAALGATVNTAPVHYITRTVLWCAVNRIFKTIKIIYYV